MAPVRISVVVATHNRPDSLRRLLGQLAHQACSPDDYEVIVVDDASSPPTALPPRGELPFAVTLITLPHSGAAAARDRGIRAARGEVVVVLDDDMQVGSGFVEARLRCHPPGSRNVVLGHIRPDPSLQRMPLFERYHAAMLDRFVAQMRSGARPPEGTDVCTGNVSFPRTEYLAVGGFDTSLARSEDAEIGIRFQKAGLKLAFSEESYTLHSSDHQSLGVWMRRAFLYGIYDLRIANKHSDFPAASPWRFFDLVSPLSRPLLLAAALVPSTGWLFARAALATSLVVDRLGGEAIAIAGTTFAYGAEYFRGVRSEAGSLRSAVIGLRRYRARRGAPMPAAAAPDSARPATGRGADPA